MKGFYKRGTFAIKIAMTCVTALIYFEKPLSAQQVLALANKLVGSTTSWDQ